MTYYYYPHFLAEETEAQKNLNNFLEVTELTNGKARLQT